VTFARRLAVLLCFEAGLCGVCAERARADEPKPWVFAGEAPLPAWARSAEVTRADEPLYQEPSSASARRGAAMLGARLPLLGARRGPGCKERFLLVGPLAWLCGDGARWVSAAADTDDELPKTRSRDGLPYRYYFVGPDGSLGYGSAQTAEEGVPETQLLKGFGVGVLRIENNPEGDPFGLTSQGFWVPMRDLIPIAPQPFHGQELVDGALNVAWVTGTNAQGSRAPDKQKDPQLKLARFQALNISEERELAGHRWYRYGTDAWISDRDAQKPTAAPQPSDLRKGERWLDVDLKSQVLTAYVGERAVFATLVSTGRGADGTVLGTPRGAQRVWVKLRTSDMDNLDDQSAAQNYAIQAVPWVMYFDHGYGLHGTFWHHEFGTKHSHGCVNLSPLDAERLFAWSSPRLPPGWNAVLPTPYDLGTLIRVR
jgi:lipoprotein-anchoring transpeptidase ErfK/SrfK